ncbi:MAG TPA: hypothetical protein VJK30_00710 [Coxiellaceae bacterium]|nr:hypothetical protein [Coxiellaceae bacterium]
MDSDRLQILFDVFCGRNQAKSNGVDTTGNATYNLGRGDLEKISLGNLSQDAIKEYVNKIRAELSKRNVENNEFELHSASSHEQLDGLDVQVETQNNPQPAAAPIASTSTRPSAAPTITYAEPTNNPNPNPHVAFAPEPAVAAFNSNASQYKKLNDRLGIKFSADGSFDFTAANFTSINNFLAACGAGSAGAVDNVKGIRRHVEVHQTDSSKLSKQLIYYAKDINAKLVGDVEILGQITKKELEEYVAALNVAVANSPVKFSPIDEKYNELREQTGVAYDPNTNAWTFSPGTEKSKKFLRIYMKLEKGIILSQNPDTQHVVMCSPENEKKGKGISLGKLTVGEMHEYAQWLINRPELSQVKIGLMNEKNAIDAAATVTTPTSGLFDSLDEANKTNVFAELFENKAKGKLATVFKNTKLEIAKKADGTNDIEFSGSDKETCVTKFTAAEINSAQNAAPATTQTTDVTLTRVKNPDNTATWSCAAEDRKIFSDENGFRLIAEQALALRTKEKELLTQKIATLTAKTNKTPAEITELNALTTKNETFNPAEIKIILSDRGAGVAEVRSDLQNARLTKTECDVIKAHLQAGFTVQYQTANGDYRTFNPNLLTQATPSVRVSPVIAPPRNIMTPAIPNDGITPSGTGRVTRHGSADDDHPVPPPRLR